MYLSTNKTDHIKTVEIDSNRKVHKLLVDKTQLLVKKVALTDHLNHEQVINM
jgi:hypothetical protein